MPDLATAASEDEASFLLRFARMIVRRRRLVLALPLGTALLSGLAAFLLMPDVYTASARILPPSPAPTASAALMGQMGGMSSSAMSLLGMRSQSDVYVAMLRSRSVADALIDKYKLGDWYGETYPTKTRRILARLSAITFSRDGVITIAVDDTDPRHAMELANAYVDELGRMNRTLAFSEAAQRRAFYEQQLAQTRDKLAEAETRARQAMARSGLVNVDAQGQAMVATTARLRGQITAAEVRITAMRGYATASNPALLQAQRELAALQQELARVEGRHGGRAEPAGAANDNLRLLREVKYNETLYELLAKQYELAKIDEAKDAGSLQVLDRAVWPDLPSGPNRPAIIFIATLLATGLALLLAYLLDALARVRGQLGRAPA